MDRMTNFLIHVLTVLTLLTLVSFREMLHVLKEAPLYFYEKFINIVVFINENFFGILGLCVVYYLLYCIIHNWEIKRRYKREIGSNNTRYTVQRCYEDGYGKDRENKYASERIVTLQLAEESTKSANEVLKKEESIDWNLLGRGNSKDPENDSNTNSKIKADSISKDINNEDNRDYYYLVDYRTHEYRRIVDRYTLLRLGYPRPSRNKEKCFKLKDGFFLKDEIKILNPIADISAILKLKD